MGYRVFFLNKLREGVEPEAYERWVREIDYPTARRDPSVIKYEVSRLEGTLSGDRASIDYLEVLEITDIAAYRQALQTPEFKTLLEEWSEFVASSEAIYGEVIE